MRTITDVEFYGIGLETYADMAFMFMTGVPSEMGGFCMMNPDVLKGQRITYVNYWARKLHALAKKMAEK